LKPVNIAYSQFCYHFRAIATLNQEWQNIYHWKEDIEKTTETANVETLTQLVTETSQKQVALIL